MFVFGANIEVVCTGYGRSERRGSDHDVSRYVCLMAEHNVSPSTATDSVHMCFPQLVKFLEEMLSGVRGVCAL